MKIEFANTDEQLLKCRAAILELRPHIPVNQYLKKARLLLSEGAKMIYVDDTTGGDSPAVAVFRTNYYFYRGNNIYIDDLICLPQHRGNGYAGTLLDFIIDQAKQTGCANIHLDSGYQKERFTAHRLYLNKGFHLASHHFVLDL
jgi:GNAT superfamily N-acetyltransferase